MLLPDALRIPLVLLYIFIIIIFFYLVVYLAKRPIVTSRQGRSHTSQDLQPCEDSSVKCFSIQQHGGVFLTRLSRVQPFWLYLRFVPTYFDVVPSLFPWTSLSPGEGGSGVAQTESLRT